jgi:1-acyl-sn-glycerol-3-phosphate acyltransferase
MYPLFWILLRKKQWFPAAFKLKRMWSRGFQVLLFCPVKATFKSPLPKPPYIVASNHCSYLDTVFMYSVFPDYFLFIGKGELLKWPLFSLFFRKMDIPVHRNNNKLAYNALQSAYEAIDRGECVAIYPEGTIPFSAPRMKPFKNGAFRMAIDKQVPVVPVTWTTNHRIMGEPTQLFSYSMPGKVGVIVHEAIYPKGKEDVDIITLRNQVFDSINSSIDPHFQKQRSNIPNEIEQ